MSALLPVIGAGVPPGYGHGDVGYPTGMRAVTWQGKRDVRVEEVPDPKIEEGGDAVIRVTSTNICGSDLHLYEVLGAFMGAGDILGHEAMGVVEEVGAEVTAIKPGDRVVIPFQMSCGHCFMCDEKLYSQCETTQVTKHGTGAALFGYSKLYGEVPGGQAEYLRVPQAQFTHIKVPDGPSDERFVYLSDVLPTAWQAVEYAAIPPGGTVVVLGLGPIGDMATRIAAHHGARVIGVDLVPERLERVRARGNEVIDLREHEKDLGDLIRDLTDGRGADSVIDAVGMEAHGSPVPKLLQTVTSMLPDALARPLMENVGVDRLAALYTAVDTVRRGGTISLSGVYGGAADPLPMLQMFDKQIQLRMGQANVKRWVDDIMPLLDDEDVLGVETFATHRIPLAEAPQAYETFQKKRDGAVKYVIKP
jgi:threonine dehydrogenase-like Zn-dependent dehydrogenase